MGKKKTKAQLAQEMESPCPQAAPSRVSGIELEPSERSASWAEVEFRQLFDRAPVGIFRTTQDGRYSFANPTLAQMYGYSSPQELIGTVTDIDDQLFVEPDRRAKFNQEMRLHGFVSGFESQARRKDNSILWTAQTSHAVRDGTGTILYYEGFVEDITERKRAQVEAARSASEARLLYSTASAAETTDSFDEALQRCLDLICEYVKWPVGHLYVPTPSGTGDLEPTSVWHLDDPQAFQLFRDVTERTRFAPGVGLPGRVLISGEPAWIADVQKDDNFPRNKLAEDIGVRGAFGFPIKIGNQTVAVLEFFTTDVLEADEHILQVMRMVGSQIGRVLERERARAMLIQQAEEALLDSNHRLEAALGELRRTQHQINHQARLRALGQMASGIAHDFNNALTPILGFSELLLTSPQHLENPDTVKRYVQMINTAAGDAATVVRNMREFYRESDETEVFDPLSLNDLIGQVISLTQAKWKDETQSKGISINLKTDLAEVPKVSGKESEIREVLINLVFNSVDAMPDGGTIRFCTRLDDNYVAIQISDTGPGMTEEVRQQCFDPFFTTKGSQGTGMGLAMTFGIVKRLNGTIDIQSELGKGTTFTIRLPVYIEEAKKETEAAPVLETKTQLHVLVIDDEPMARELVTEYLTTDGHFVESATNGREGLEKFHAGIFDLVITDRAMPEMNGDDVASAIKKETPSIPIVMLTGFGDIINANGSLSPDVNRVVSKPVSRLELQNIVNELSQ